MGVGHGLPWHGAGSVGTNRCMFTESAIRIPFKPSPFGFRSISNCDISKDLRK